MHRYVTPKVFESYTPIEMALKQATIDNPRWASNVEQAVRTAFGKSMHHDWKDRYFTKFINSRFPIATVDVAGFEQFVMELERTAVPQTNITAAWFHKKPEGQAGFSYPKMDYRGEPPSFSLFR